VGQFVVQGARIAGASVIVAVDPVDGRRAQTLGLGATHAVHPDALRDAMAEVAPEGADFGFDAVGDPATSALALRFTRSGGTTVLVGLPAAGLRLDLDPGEFLRREKFLTGTMYGSEDPALALPILLEHVAAGRLELASLIGPEFPLDEIDAAVQASLSAPAGRVLVVP
jgi:S-(hydroxymethyl)glutathione dehydrogenase/alcohol dehydrogenase